MLGLLGVLAGACRTNGPDAASDAADDDTTMTDMTSGDTSATSDSVDRRNPPPAPAPGTARVRAEIVSCNAAAAPVRCQLRVDEVLDYGSATPTLSTGERTVGLTSSLLDDRDATALDTLGPRTFVVRHAGDSPNLGEKSGTEKSPEWTIRSIEQ